LEKLKAEKKNAALSALLLVAGAIMVAAIGVASFLMADYYRVSPLWVFLGWFSLLFIAAVGKDFRDRFRSPAFVGFFLAWLVVHLLVTIISVARLPWVYWLPAVFLELWIGYAVAFRLFGLPPNQKTPGSH